MPGIARGETKAVASIRRTPVATRASSSRCLAVVPIGASICSPSRGPTSRTSTCAGNPKALTFGVPLGESTEQNPPHGLRGGTRGLLPAAVGGCTPRRHVGVGVSGPRAAGCDRTHRHHLLLERAGLRGVRRGGP